MLASGIFPDGIRKDRGHAQLVKDKPKRQTLCLRSVALAFSGSSSSSSIHITMSSRIVYS